MLFLKKRARFGGKLMKNNYLCARKTIQNQNLNKFFNGNKN